MSAVVETTGTVDMKVPGWAPGETRMDVPRERLVEACSTVAALPGARLATMVGLDDRADSGAFRLVYTFALPKAQWATVETAIPPDDPTFPSTALAIPAANWYEREVRDLLGLVPAGHPDPRPLVFHDDWPEGVYPLRKDFDPAIPVPRVEREQARFHHLHGDGITEIPVGPIHAGVIEPGHFRFAAVGERILHLEVRLFYTHRGIEKVAEGKSVMHALQIAERTCGVCAFSHAISYCQAIEQLAGIEVPARAQAIRTLLLELERLYNHAGDLGNICAGIGFAVAAALGARIKDELQRLNERITGNRFLRSTATIGGLRRDLDAAALRDIDATLKLAARDIQSLVELIWSSDTAVERLKTTGILPAETARALGAVGVAARGSGLDLDCRRDHPHAFYDQVRGSLGVPVRSEGDAEARALIRSDEILVSLALVNAILHALPAGPVLAPTAPIPGSRTGFAVTESPRGENLHWVRTAADGTIDRLRIRSASYPNWPAVVAAVPGNMVPDFPLINKTFELCYACLDR